MKDVIIGHQPAAKNAERIRAKRYPEMWGLIISFLVLALFGILRLQQAFIGWNWLLARRDIPGPLYFAAGGTAWAVLCLVASIGLWFRIRWAPMFTRVVSLVLCAAYWLERILFSRFSIDEANNALSLLLSIVFLFSIFIILAMPRQRWYFK